MAQLPKSRTLSVSIDRSPAEVYGFVSNPENLPRWAPAFVRSVKKQGNDWIIETSDGPMRMRFVAQNELGVLDHYVKLQNGVEVFNPMRVLANGAGSEVLFTALQPATMANERFVEDVAMIERDLRTLKSVLER
jgi:carbon monoxide dehydrogenase subunit G